MVKSLNKPHVIESHVMTVSKYLLKCHLHKLFVYKQLHSCYHSAHFQTQIRIFFFKVKLSVACPALFCLQHQANFKIFKYIFPNTRLHCVKRDSIRVKKKKRGHLAEATGKFSCLQEKEKKKQPRVSLKHALNTKLTSN